MRQPRKSIAENAWLITEAALLMAIIAILISYYGVA